MVVVGARAAAALGAAAVVVGGLPIALPAQLRALGGSVARVDRRLQAVESMDILGTIQQESVAPNPENVRATCYMGLIEEVTTKCNLLDDDGEEVPPGVWYYEKTEGWNMSPRGESDVLCLQCCSQLYDEPNERIHEEWNFDCAVDATVRTKFDTGYYGYEFRSVWKSNLQPGFNVSVIERFGPDSLAVLRELNESNRFVQNQPNRLRFDRAREF